MVHYDRISSGLRFQNSAGTKKRVIKMSEIKKLKPDPSGRKPRVGFICVHNACRSQIAEALGKHLAGDVFESYSAGTHIKDQINQDALRMMKEIYGIDMEQTQSSKLLSDIPEPDIVITMGCNVDCPHLPCRYREDWGLDDPSGKGDDVFSRTIKTIEGKILELKDALKRN